MSIPNNKHAYLIAAHNNFDQLQILLDLLDNPRNDIYLHIDKKSTSFDNSMVSTKHSGLFIIDRINVNWGGHSQIECTLNLLKKSHPNHYQYYHLISGIDMPVKTQKYIHDFFDENNGKNFIEFDQLANSTGSFFERIDYYYFFQNIVGRQNGKIFFLMKKAEEILVFLQRRIGIKRKKYIDCYKGTNWFSITDEVAGYILSKERIIKKQFYHSVCADEIFLHSIVMGSPYKQTIVNDCMRAIDWKRGNPYTYRYEDIDGLFESHYLFARKLNINIDKSAVEKIKERLSSK